MKKTSKKEEDASIRLELKEMDSWAIRLYFFIPLILLVIGGTQLARYTPLFWMGFSIIYILAFRAFTEHFSSEQERIIARLSKSYAGYQLSWCLLLLAGLFFVIAIFKMVAGD